MLVNLVSPTNHQRMQVLKKTKENKMAKDVLDAEIGWQLQGCSGKIYMPQLVGKWLLQVANRH